MNIKKFTISSMLAALCAILGFIAIDIGNLKFSFEGVPILVAALAYGPKYGILVGGVGPLLYQILRYGFSATTLLWIIPYIIQGYICGLYAKKYRYRNTNLQLSFIIILTTLLVTILNTGIIFIDSKIYSYYSFIYVFGLVPLRLIIAIIKGILYSIFIPTVLNNLSKVTHDKFLCV